MQKHEVTIYKNETPTAESAPYLGRSVLKNLLESPELVEIAARYAEVEPIAARAIIDGSVNAWLELEKQAATVIITPLGSIRCVLHGTFDGLDSPFDPAKNSLELILSTPNDLRNYLAGEVPSFVNEDTTTKIQLFRVADCDEQKPYNVIHGVETFWVQGKHLVAPTVYVIDDDGVRIDCEIVADEGNTEQNFKCKLSEGRAEGFDGKIYVESRGTTEETYGIQTVAKAVKVLGAPQPVITMLVGNPSCKEDFTFELGDTTITITGERLKLDTADSKVRLACANPQSGEPDHVDLGVDDFSTNTDGNLTTPMVDSFTTWAPGSEMTFTVINSHGSASHSYDFTGA